MKSLLVLCTVLAVRTFVFEDQFERLKRNDNNDTYEVTDTTIPATTTQTIETTSKETEETGTKGCLEK